LTGSTPGGRRLINLNCKWENIALFFLQAFTTYKGQEFLTGSREGQKEFNKVFSKGGWGRKPHLFLNLFNEPFTSKIA